MYQWTSFPSSAFHHVSLVCFVHIQSYSDQCVMICIKFCTSLRSYKSNISVYEGICVDPKIIDLFFMYFVFLHYFKINYAFNILGLFMRESVWKVLWGFLLLEYKLVFCIRRGILWWDFILSPSRYLGEWRCSVSTVPSISMQVLIFLEDF